MSERSHKPVIWMGSSLDVLRNLSPEVRNEIGFALYQAQLGVKHANAKPLKGFGGAGVMEIIENDSGGTYRTVYTVRFAAAVYVLHVFQKKSKTGKKTPKHEIDLIRDRLRQAAEHYEAHGHDFEQQTQAD
jgi:phage-related protein